MSVIESWPFIDSVSSPLDSAAMSFHLAALHEKVAAKSLQVAALERCADCPAASAGSLQAKFAATWACRRIVLAAHLLMERDNAATSVNVAAKQRNIAALLLDIAAL